MRFDLQGGTGFRLLLWASWLACRWSANFFLLSQGCQRDGFWVALRPASGEPFTYRVHSRFGEAKISTRKPHLIVSTDATEAACSLTSSSAVGSARISLASLLNAKKNRRRGPRTGVFGDLTWFILVFQLFWVMTTGFVLSDFINCVEMTKTI